MMHSYENFYKTGFYSLIVLILVLMDDALVRKDGEESGKVFKCLNPCFNG